LWICFDCRKLNAKKKCIKEHRCLNIDMRMWYDDNIIAFVNDRIYTTSSRGIILGERIREKYFMDHTTRGIVEEGKIDVIRCGGREVRYKIFTEEEWKEVEKRAREIRFNEDLDLMDERLEKIYINMIKKGDVDPRNYNVLALRRGVAEHGFKFAEEVRRRIESNELLSKKAKMKVIGAIFENIL